nr:NEDD4-binding protein 2 isoform X2 [Misgurnus anguillicaudatus]
MPKKKKNGQSPSRGAMKGSGPEIRTHGTFGSAVTQADSSWGNSNFGSTLSMSGQSGSQRRDEIIQSMQEMFSDLDPEVIYMVLSEADFKVENAMDSLLVLSDAVDDGMAPPPPRVSGFEEAAALLGTAQSIASSNQPASQTQHSLDETHLTEEFDTLLDRELATFAPRQTQASSLMSSIPLSALPPPSQSIPLSSLPRKSQTHISPPQTLSEGEQLNQEGNTKCGSVTEQTAYSNPRLSEASGGSSPVGELSFGGGRISEQKNVSLDFSHLTLEASSTEPRPSAFHVYRRPEQLHNHTRVSAVSQHNEALHTPAMFWNAQATEFHPRSAGPAFITPVIPNPTPWNMNPIPAAQWLAQRPMRQPPLKPSATVPQSWTLPPKNRLKLEGHVLVLLRGAPGSGKTTLALAMLDQNPGGVVLSTDDYFTRNGQYYYELNSLGEAHEWNHQRAKEAFEKGQTPIIIDNTNMQCWEMKPYVAMAQKYRYKVLFREPDTWWKAKPRELEKRTRHQVTKEKIRRMLDRYDRFVSVQSIMYSQRPEPVPSVVDLTQTDAGQPQQSLPPGISHPDLVGDSGFSKLNPYLSSSMPDVSSVRQTFSPVSKGEEEGETASFSSKEPILFGENTVEGSGTPQLDLLDGEGLDFELDGCLVDSGTTKERLMEQPVAFSESIAQRVKRDRAYDRKVLGANTTDQPVNFDPKDESSGQDKEEGCEEEPLSEDNVVRPELLDFVGDWPLESQSQRHGRCQTARNDSVKKMEMESSAVEERENVSSSEDEQSSPDKLNQISEFQKLIDLLQGGGNPSPGPSKPTPQNSQFLGEREEDLNLETMSWSELPDCVQKFSECTDPSNDLFNSGRKQKEELTEQLTQVSAEEDTGMHTQDKVEEDKTLLSEDKSSMSPNIQESHCVRAGVETDSSIERRRGLSRRIGKPCKLALTFTNQSPSSPPSQSPFISHLSPGLTPSGETPSLHMASCSSASTQTHPQDFAVLWRIDQRKCFAVSSDFTCKGVVILEGNPLRFTPKTIEEPSACQQGVPYRVVHEKGCQVEENDVRESHSKQHNLEILSLHFRRVSMEILEDLYEKCHQDLEWTTNLLLDSGERLYKEDEEEADLGCLVPVEASSDYRNGEKVSSIETSETAIATDVQPTRDACKPDLCFDEPNVEDSCNSSASSVSPKSQETNLSDLSQADDDWSTGQSSQSEAEGSDEGVSMKTEKCEPSIVHQPTVDTKEDDPDLQGQDQEETLVTESGKTHQCLEGALGAWGEEEEGGENVKEEEETRTEVDAITQSILHQVVEMERREAEERKEREKERRRTDQEKRDPKSMDIQTLELKLPTELALQLTELFGPVGVSPGAFSPDDCAVQIDLNLAKLLHQKWKETIQEKHRHAALSYQLLQETGSRDQSLLGEEVPFMDHWSMSCAPISLRNIMIEEQVMQDCIEKSRTSRKDLDKKDSAAKLKENQLFSMFPTIDRHFLGDLFRDHNYSLEQTEQFLHALLDDGPVKNVVASEPASQRNNTSRAQSKERRVKPRDAQEDAAQFQDTEDPEYKDFRTEALLHKQRQIESFNKAAEAHRQRRKDVASFYAQQGRMHGEKMREANHLAAMQIFERVNASLLPENILDLHGLHVDEAIHHLIKVLDDKTSEWHQGLCGPQLSVITGKGNHSQGGVARIRPAVLDYLKTHHYSYTEPKTGLVLVTLH